MSCTCHATSLPGDHYCNCTCQSTCKTHKCSCIQAGTPCQSCICSDKCCNCATSTNVTLSVCPIDELAPQTAVAQNSLDPPSDGLTTAALPWPLSILQPPLSPSLPRLQLPPCLLATSLVPSLMWIGFWTVYTVIMSMPTPFSSVWKCHRQPGVADLSAIADCLPLPAV